MKRLRFIFLAVIILATMVVFSVCANAAVIASGNCGDNGDNVKWELDYDGTLSISGSGRMKDVSFANPEGEFYYYSSEQDTIRNKVVRVVVLDGVTHISGFINCRNLLSVEIPQSVTSIGEEAFYSCKSLDSIDISDNVVSIGYGAFAMTALKEIILPDSVEFLGGAAFYGCKSLTYVRLPVNIDEIGECTFGDTKISNISIPDGVKSIGRCAFVGCSELSNVVLPDSIEEIGFCIFLNCDLIKEITLPENLKHLEYGFSHNDIEINIPENSDKIFYVDDVLFIDGGKTLFKY